MVAVDDQDELDQSNAPLIDHLIELRRRLIYCVVAILVCFAFCYVFAQDIYNFLLIPYKLAVGGETRIELIYTAPQEFFFTQVRVAFFGAIALAFPIIASQVYMFVAPGLYRRERKAFAPFLVAAPLLFLTGGAIVFFIVMPLAMRFFLSMQQTGDSQVHIQLTARVSEYLHLITTLILAFGICFQLPVVLTLLARAGVVTSGWLVKQWRYAVVLIFIVAAFLAPPDLPSMTALAIPTLALYGVSVLVVRLVERQRAKQEGSGA